jgi:hypothetical protein
MKTDGDVNIMETTYEHLLSFFIIIRVKNQKGSIR